MHTLKTPGPVGHPALFYKQSWSIIGTDIVTEVQIYFATRKLNPYWNHTYITLISKVHNPTSSEFRPISLCNVIYL